MKIYEKLSNNISCYWDIEKSLPSEKYKIISVVFFLKENTFENNKKYIFGINNILNNFDKYFPDFRLRIYYDNSSNYILKNIIKKNKKNKKFNNNNIELYKYEIPIFYDNNKKKHKGTIGTLIRFLPLYDYELHKVDECIIFDIDNKIGIFNHTIYEKLKKKNMLFGYRSRVCYGFKNRILCINDKNIIEFPIIASLIYNFISLPNNILGDFLDDLYYKKNEDSLKFIESCEIINEYEYGIDEIFINNYHLRYLFQKKIKVSPIYFSHCCIGAKLIELLSYFTLEQKSKFFIFLQNFFEQININQENFNEENMGEFLDLNIKNIEGQLKKFHLSKKIIDFLYINKNIIDNQYFSMVIKCIIKGILYVDPNKINLLVLKTNYKNNKTVIDDIKIFSSI
jgi:hypothetical protein